ncbi:MAG TPA: efflux RND transporter periplasmic adaptor subunit [Chthoniobacteraceae bacterium]|nr:efflux RND transporter periplasmic adaptor subunit [Chthoniobacteraceae bacterium]
MSTPEIKSAEESVEPQTVTPSRSRIASLVTLVVVAVLATAGFKAIRSRLSAEGNPAGPGGPPPAPKVTVATVEQRTITDHRELLGRVESIEIVEVRPRVSGHIADVRLQAGQLVKKGDVLFVIDPRWHRAQFDLATAAVERAKVRVRITEREAKRSADLFASKTISIEEADARTSRFDEARAELLAAEATLDSARLDLEHTEVRAPISGRVNRAYVTAGNLVSGAPGSATLLTTIVSVGEMYVYADVDETTLLAFNRLSREGRILTENGKVPVEMQLSDETTFGHRGHIESAENRMDAGSGSLALRMVFPNPEDQLVPGLSARIRLPVSAPQPALLISERAVGTDQSQKFVLTVAEDNKVVYRTVKLGPLLDGKRIVRDGLRTTDRVIVNGVQRARPGMTVSPESAPEARVASN